MAQGERERVGCEVEREVGPGPKLAGRIRCINYLRVLFIHLKHLRAATHEILLFHALLAQKQCTLVYLCGEGAA